MKPLRWGYSKDTLTKVLAYIRDEARMSCLTLDCQILTGVTESGRPASIQKNCHADASRVGRLSQELVPPRVVGTIPVLSRSIEQMR